MPLSTQQVKELENLMNGYDTEEGVHTEGLNDKVNRICSAREDVYAMIRINEDISDESANTIIEKLKNNVQSNAQELIDLMSGI